MSDPFEEHLEQWREWCEAPWGRLRFAVVGETLHRQVEVLARPGTPLRVLDVGGGDGRDAVPLAADGHHVTVLDPAAGWLREARARAASAGVADRVRTVEGSLDDLAGLGMDFDLVLCHFVLHYRPAGAGDLARLGAVLRPGGRVSVMAPNPAGRVLMRLTREGPEAALEELDATTYPSVTLETTGRKLTAEQVTDEAVESGLVPVARYGVRVANDYLTDDAAKTDPHYFASLLRLELALCDREPYLRGGGMWQVVAERPDRSAGR